ncbi:MAG: bifunctional glutamate N-acetyltransferase/amino-acid acetyltransferase ArgJ [Oscillospiraceae bacterium]|jgi:glutamate N-acetyltransferase/amino-acid N-acetyltransferase|nr:bifunctional glutamate N-acetyltransferase/amino-acid acetyltransferase ArgJ [Oscillospiraceae bacterium]
MTNQSSYITMPKGYLAAGVHCGMKKDGKPDLALVVSECSASVAGVYTRNIVQGHSLRRTRRLVSEFGTCRGVLINSVSANACIGPVGEEDADRVAAEAARVIGVRPEEILTCSTGVIGKRLPVEKMTEGITELEKNLSASEEAAHSAMRAIMTTDLVPKEASAVVEINGNTVTISGMAKGSGMIHPDLATLIGIITTDAAIDPSSLDTLLRDAVKYTINRVSVDGDTSVCDTVLMMANGMSGQEIKSETDEYELFAQALESVARDLAQMIAADGEGATKLIEVRVEGAPSEEDALLIVRSICRSPLCKTAIFGEDANWGRILTAAGYSGANFDPDRTDIYFGTLQVCKGGCALDFDEAEAKRILSESTVLIDVRLHSGSNSDRMWTCDFSYDYVKINGSYRT